MEYHTIHVAHSLVHLGSLVSNSCGHGDPKIITWPAYTQADCAQASRVKWQTVSQGQARWKNLLWRHSAPILEGVAD